MVTVHKEIALGRRVGSLDAGAAHLHELAYPPDHAQPAHAHARSSISLVLKGGGSDFVEGAEHGSCALTVMIKPAGAVHRTHFGEAGMHTILLEVPESLDRLLRRVCGVFDRCRWLNDPAVSASMLNLYVTVSRCGGMSSDAFAKWARSMSRLACGAPIPCRHDAHAFVTDAMMLIERHYRTPIQVCRIARELRVHPVYLARLFRAQLGTSVRAQIERRRVTYLADRLAESGVSIGRIALEAGFTDHAHGCRAFQKHTGITPSAYRAIVQRLIAF